MLKQISAIIAATFALSATAGEFAELTYSPSVKNETTKAIVADKAGLVVGTDFFKVLKLDGKLEGSRARASGNLTDTAEVRGTFELPLFGYGSAFARGGVGRSWTAGNDYNFYTYAGGASFNLPSNFVALASAERNNAMKAGNPHSTTYEGGVGYNFSKADQVKAVWQRTKGDVNTSGFQLGYSHSF